MVRVLHELANLDGGGVARLLYDYYRHMNHEVIHFDFLINDEIDNGILEAPLKELGCKVYKLPSPKKDLKKRLKEIDFILKTGNYDVVHSHISARSCLILAKAKKYSVKKRFVHSHIAYQDISSIKRIMDKGFLACSKALCTQLFACGIEAGEYMWGKKATALGKVKIMRNAVSTEAFKFNSQERIHYRDELGIDNKKAIGIVGRLDYQKNHDFLLDVFAEIEKKKPGEYKLLVIGRGPYEQRLKSKANQLGIIDDVVFLGVRSDVSKLLNAIDVFVLPSHYEGLPVVLVVAQANGLPEIVSDTITKEMSVTNLVEFLSLEDTFERWATSIIEAANRDYGNREDYASTVKEAGYDIVCESEKMQAFYLEDASDNREGKGVH